MTHSRIQLPSSSPAQHSLTSSITAMTSPPNSGSSVLVTLLMLVQTLSHQSSSCSLWMVLRELKKPTATAQELPTISEKIYCRDSYGVSGLGY